MVSFAATGGITSALMPVVLAEVLGLKRFGTLAGMLGLAATFGMAAGPMVVGWAVDLTSDYALAFELCAASCAVAAVCGFTLRPAESMEVVALRQVAQALEAQDRDVTSAETSFETHWKCIYKEESS